MDEIKPHKLAIALEAPESPPEASVTAEGTLAPEDYLDPDWVDVVDNDGPPWGFEDPLEHVYPICEDFLDD